MPAAQDNAYHHDDSVERGRKRRPKSPVDWVKYFGGKPPTEIIEIHDDDSPAPPATIQRLRPPTTNGTATTQHVDKKRRVNGGSGEVPTYSETNTPYSHSNGTSTESLQTTTAATSLGSQASIGSRIDTTQTGQKRKRTTRTSDAERKKQETQHAGPKGYLAEYGEYVPPPKQYKKQKDVVVPAIHDVRCAKLRHCFISMTDSAHSATNPMTRLMTRTATTSFKRIAAWAKDIISSLYWVREHSARSSAPSTYALEKKSPSRSSVLCPRYNTSSIDFLSRAATDFSL